MVLLHLNLTILTDFKKIISEYSQYPFTFGIEYSVPNTHPQYSYHRYICSRMQEKPTITEKP